MEAPSTKPALRNRGLREASPHRVTGQDLVAFCPAGAESFVNNPAMGHVLLLRQMHQIAEILASMNFTKILRFRLPIAAAWLLLSPAAFCQVPDWIWLAEIGRAHV